jgi:hypothetical protein
MAIHMQQTAPGRIVKVALLAIIHELADEMGVGQGRDVVGKTVDDFPE